MPFASKAQHRAFRAMESRGELPKGTSHTWAEHTENMKDLPEKVEKSATFSRSEFVEFYLKKNERMAERRGEPKPKVKSAAAAKDFAPLNDGGVAEKHPSARVPMSEVRKGTQAEKEHTSSTAKARAIAVDHVVQIPDYYERLEKLEGEAKADGAKRAATVTAVPAEAPTELTAEQHQAELAAATDAANADLSKHRILAELAAGAGGMASMLPGVGLLLPSHDELREDAHEALQARAQQHAEGLQTLRIRPVKAAGIDLAQSATQMSAAPRGDELHLPMGVNPYSGDQKQTAEYENGFAYPQALGHQMLNQATEGDITRWTGSSNAWRAGFASACDKLGLGRVGQLVAPTAEVTGPAKIGLYTAISMLRISPMTGEDKTANMQQLFAQRALVDPLDNPDIGPARAGDRVARGRGIGALIGTIAGAGAGAYAGHELGGGILSGATHMGDAIGRHLPFYDPNMAQTVHDGFTDFGKVEGTVSGGVGGALLGRMVGRGLGAGAGHVAKNFASPDATAAEKIKQMDPSSGLAHIRMLEMSGNVDPSVLQAMKDTHEARRSGIEAQLAAGVPFKRATTEVPMIRIEPMTVETKEASIGSTLGTLGGIAGGAAVGHFAIPTMHWATMPGDAAAMHHAIDTQIQPQVDQALGNHGGQVALSLSPEQLQALHAGIAAGHAADWDSLSTVGTVVGAGVGGITGHNLGRDAGQSLGLARRTPPATFAPMPNYAFAGN